MEAFSTPDTDAFLWDTEVMGFGVRAKASGAKAFVLSYRIANRPRRLTISKVGSPYTVDEARERARELIRQASVGVDPAVTKVEQRTAVTVGELVDLYLEEGPALKPNKKSSSWATDRSVIECHVKPLLCRKLADSLTGLDIARFQMDIAIGKTARDVKLGPRRRSRVQGGRRVAALSTAILGAALTFGVQTKRLKSNPAQGVQLFTTTRKERFLSELEVALLAASIATLERARSITSTMGDAIRLLLLTGCRKTEVLSLEWNWVDFEKGCLRLPDSKTGAKVVPLASAAIDLLRARWTGRPLLSSEDEQHPSASPYVFPAARGSGWCVGLPKAWAKVKTAATEQAATLAADDLTYAGVDLTGVRLHDLRHSFASFAIADGASLFMVGKVLGHRQTRTTEVYAHLRDDPLRLLADRTGARLRPPWAEAACGSIQASVGALSGQHPSSQ